MPVWTPVINMQLVWQTAALDGGAQHILASAGVLVSHPAAMHQESTEVIHEHSVESKVNRVINIGYQQPAVWNRCPTNHQARRAG